MGFHDIGKNTINQILKNLNIIFQLRVQQYVMNDPNGRHQVDGFTCIPETIA